MAREMIEGDDLEKVVGGTISFNEDCSTCGYFCNDQYKVNDFSAALDYINENKGKMSERKMLSNMVDAGYLSGM